MTLPDERLAALRKRAEEAPEKVLTPTSPEVDGLWLNSRHHTVILPEELLALLDEVAEARKT